MLIRSLYGDEFHIVRVETGKFYLCLCGEKIPKHNIASQRMADSAYVRCWPCRKIEHARVLARREQTNWLAWDSAEAVSRRKRPAAGKPRKVRHGN